MVRRWPTLLTPSSFSSACCRAAKTSPVIPSSAERRLAKIQGGAEAEAGTPMPRTSKGIRVLLEAKVGDEVGRLVLVPLHDVAGGAALAVAGMGKGGRCVFSAQRPRAGGRALVLDGQGRAGDGLALKLVVGIRVLVILCGVGHDGAAGGWQRGAR
jgi:hypothetical protein